MAERKDMQSRVSWSGVAAFACGGAVVLAYVVATRANRGGLARTILLRVPLDDVTLRTVVRDKASAGTNADDPTPTDCERNLGVPATG